MRDLSANSDVRGKFSWDFLLEALANSLRVVYYFILIFFLVFGSAAWIFLFRQDGFFAIIFINIWSVWLFFYKFLLESCAGAVFFIALIFLIYRTSYSVILLAIYSWYSGTFPI